MKGCDFVGVAPLQFTDLSSPTFYPEIVSSAKRLMLRLQSVEPKTSTFQVPVTSLGTPNSITLERLLPSELPLLSMEPPPEG